MKWYRKAAARGDAAAQFNLGVMYFHGQGVPQDYVQAHLWFNLSAAREGEKNATRNRNITAKRMSAPQIAEAQRLARERRKLPDLSRAQSCRWPPFFEGHVGPRC